MICVIVGAFLHSCDWLIPNYVKRWRFRWLWLTDSKLREEVTVQMVVTDWFQTTWRGDSSDGCDRLIPNYVKRWQFRWWWLTDSKLHEEVTVQMVVTDWFQTTWRGDSSDGCNWLIPNYMKRWQFRWLWLVHSIWSWQQMVARVVSSIRILWSALHLVCACVCVRAVNCGSMWTVSMEICNAWPTLQQPIQPPLNNFWNVPQQKGAVLHLFFSIFLFSAQFHYSKL